MSWDAAKRVFTLQGIAGLPAAVIAPRTVAKAVLTPEGRKALISLGRYTKPTQSAIRSAAYLAGLAAASDSDPKEYWSSTGGKKMLALPGEQRNVPPQMAVAAAKSLASQAGTRGAYLDPDKLATALERMAPAFRQSAVAELIRQGRIPPINETRQ